MTEPLLSVRDLSVAFATRRGPLIALDGVSFDIAPGEVLGVVGESGAGKSLTGLAIIGLLDPPGQIGGGEIRLEGARIDNLPPARMREIRGRRIGIIFQDPLTSLNPLLRIGDQLTETILAHSSLTSKQARERAINWLAEVGIPAPEKRIDGYPHEFSGGMRQRVVIALALCAEPALVIADEPTTALDVSVQAQIISVLKNLARRHGAAVMLITHDMGVIAETADRVAVMYAGRIVEIGKVGEVVRAPLHPYAQGLMAAIPTLETRVARLAQIPGAMPRLSAIPRGCAFRATLPEGLRALRGRAPAFARNRRAARGVLAACGCGGSLMSAADEIVVVSGLRRIFDVSSPWITRLIDREPRRLLKAVDGLDFAIARGETLGIVGESGSGKSTLARMIVGLLQASAGRVTIDGIDIAATDDAAARRAVQRRIQMIFQDPYASLNPRWRVGDIIAEPILAFGLRLETGPPSKRRIERRSARRSTNLSDLVGLHEADARKYPHEFSGGQRQRVAIARALASQPDFIVCDEPTSALDVSIQAQILNLMRDLQEKLGLTYLLITHNLAVVRFMATRVGVMYLGRLVELDATDALFSRPRHPYTAHAARCGAGPGDERTRAHARGRRTAQSDRAAAGLSVSSALPDRAIEVCQRETPAFVDDVACHRAHDAPNWLAGA